jgi:hypothetical protein
VEIHHVVTDDGYIFDLHRIPFGRPKTPYENRTTQRKAVFLQHRLFNNIIIIIICIYKAPFSLHGQSHPEAHNRLTTLLLGGGEGKSVLVSF